MWRFSFLWGMRIWLQKGKETFFDVLQCLGSGSRLLLTGKSLLLEEDAGGKLVVNPFNSLDVFEQLQETSKPFVFAHQLLLKAEIFVDVDLPIVKT